MAPVAGSTFELDVWRNNLGGRTKKKGTKPAETRSCAVLGVSRFLLANTIQLYYLVNYIPFTGFHKVFLKTHNRAFFEDHNKTIHLLC